MFFILWQFQLWIYDLWFCKKLYQIIFPTMESDKLIYNCSKVTTMFDKVYFKSACWSMKGNQLVQHFRTKNSNKKRDFDRVHLKKQQAFVCIMDPPRRYSSLISLCRVANFSFFVSLFVMFSQNFVFIICEKNQRKEEM